MKSHLIAIYLGGMSALALLIIVLNQQLAAL